MRNRPRETYLDWFQTTYLANSVVEKPCVFRYVMYVGRRGGCSRWIVRSFLVDVDRCRQSLKAWSKEPHRYHGSGNRDAGHRIDLVLLGCFGITGRACMHGSW